MNAAELFVLIAMLEHILFRWRVQRHFNETKTEEQAK